MAILKHIQAQVVVNDSVAIEYDDPDPGHDPRKAMAKYIEAISDAKFKIKLRTKSAYKHNSGSLTYIVYVDGDMPPGRSCRLNEGD